MPLQDQQSFVGNTERDAMLLNTSGSVHWEFTGGWERAIQNFMPLYASNNIVKGACTPPHLCILLLMKPPFDSI